MSNTKVKSKMAAPAHKTAALKPAPQAVPEPVAPAVEATEASATEGKRPYEVQYGIPMPDRTRRSSGESIYPFKTMEVGGSFFVGATDKNKEPWKTLAALASRMTRELYPKYFQTMRLNEEGVEGIRIWRNKDATEPLKEVKKRKPSTDLAQEAVDGDTSNAQPEPMFE